MPGTVVIVQTEENRMLCVIAKLAPDVNEKLSRLRQTAMPQVHFSSPLYAHITLATYLPEDAETFIAFCREMLLVSVRYPFAMKNLRCCQKPPLLWLYPLCRIPCVPFMTGLTGISVKVWTAGHMVKTGIRTRRWFIIRPWIWTQSAKKCRSILFPLTPPSNRLSSPGWKKTGITLWKLSVCCNLLLI